MRKVVAVELVSLEGVMEEWAFSYSNDEMEEANSSGMAASDAAAAPLSVRCFEATPSTSSGS
jgi:hypothetical protein